MLRKRNSSWLIYTILTVAIVALAVGVASAQSEPPNTYSVTYYSNALTKGAPGGTVHLVNPGSAVTSIDADGHPLNGNLCAMIYVFNNDEQEEECCGCTLSPDSERTISINTNLLGNPLNILDVTTDGVIKVVSAPPNTTAKTCRPDLSNIAPTAEVQAWATHIQNPKPLTYIETEEEFSSVPLNAFELEFLEHQCSAIFTSGSGHGKCSCGYGD